MVIIMFNNNSKEEANNKLLLLYIVDRFEIPMTDNQITELVMEREILNYFVQQQFLSELVDIALLEYTNTDGVFYYLITEKGKETLSYFIDRLEVDLLKKLDISIEKKKDLIHREMQISARYEKKGKDDYTVDLRVVENDINLIHIELDVVSNKQAKMICDNWKTKAQHIYGDIIKLLI